jgi:alkylation response protein AidB-like acyl-CoA dehydrogenase
VDFSLSEEQALLADSVRRFVRERLDVAAWQRIATGAAEGDPADWQRMAALGWLGLAVPEEAGGAGATPVETMVVMEELGRGLLAQPVVETAVLGAALLRHAVPERRRELLAALAAGGLRVALAAIERAQRFDLSRVATIALRDGDGWRLDGEKSFVPAASGADLFVVTAADAAAGGMSLFLVPADAPGLLRSDYVTADARRASALRLDGVRVPRDALVGPAGGGWPLLEAAVDRAIAALCAEAVGAMDALRDATGEYLKTRKQFGQALGSFQALQHRMADIYVACEESRSQLLLATLKLESERRERVRAVSAAKARIGQLGRFVAHQAIQLHGAMGMCEEVAVGHYAKRLMAIDLLFGDSAFHRRRFATA